MRNTKIQRWAILINQYGCEIKYKPGHTNIHADMLSRLPANPNDNESTSEIDPNVDEIDIIDTDLCKLTKPRKDFQIDMEQDVEIEHDELEVFAMSTVDIAKQQKEDKDFGHIIDKIEDGVNNKETEEYLMDSGLLYHISGVTKYHPEHGMQLCVPTPLRALVLKECHDNSGHLGIDKLYNRVRANYFWPGLYKESVEYKQKCETCKLREMKCKISPLQPHYSPSYPMEVISIDTVGPYCKSYKGNVYVLTVICHYSSWVECYPMPDKRAETVARLLLTEFIPRHGCMKVLVSDRGTEFCNQVIECLTTEMNIFHAKTAPFHPQSNSKIEVFHKTLNNVIAKSLKGDQREWDTYIPCVLMAYRTSVNESTKYTPFFLTYGRDALSPLQSILTAKDKYRGSEYLPTMLERLHEAHVIVKTNMQEARERNQRQVDKKAEQRDFQPGDPVYYYNSVNEIGTSRKLKTPWEPHYRIIKKITPVTYKIQQQTTGKIKITSLEHIRLANPDEAWDQPNDKVTPVVAKYKPSAEHKEREQPMRACRLATPTALGPTAGSSDDSEHEDPNNETGSGTNNEHNEIPGVDNDQNDDQSKTGQGSEGGVHTPEDNEPADNDIKIDDNKSESGESDISDISPDDNPIEAQSGLSSSNIATGSNELTPYHSRYNLRQLPSRETRGGSPSIKRKGDESREYLAPPKLTRSELNIKRSLSDLTTEASPPKLTKAEVETVTLPIQLETENQIPLQAESGTRSAVATGGEEINEVEISPQCQRTKTKSSKVQSIAKGLKKLLKIK